MNDHNKKSVPLFAANTENYKATVDKLSKDMAMFLNLSST